MNRRNFLKMSGLITAQSAFAGGLIQSLWTTDAHGAPVPLAELQKALAPTDGKIVLPTDALFAQYQPAFNKRTLKIPQVRVLCSTPQGVAIAIAWARNNNVELAARAGGHSYEGFSQSTGLVIDLRPANSIQISPDHSGFIAGAGSQLGNVYGYLANFKKSLPAGSCPTVGLTGHTLGGGFGLLGRAFGLACDSLVEAELVDAEGKILNVNASENADLFWALRGGGAGSFGVVTKLQYKTHPIENVFVFGMGWSASPKVAAQLMMAWQHWAPLSPREITSLFKTSRGTNGLINLRVIGQTIGSEQQLRTELANLTKIAGAVPAIQPLPFMQAVRHFGGSFAPESVFMKGKSDYLIEVMSDEAAVAFLTQLPAGVGVIFDSYGGAVRDVNDADTAFVHRSNTLSSLQYYSQWESAADTPAKLATLRKFHEAMRPFMSGYAYFNYCDTDIKNYAQAYWGSNLERLVSVKQKFDPLNVFHHAQSIPLKLKAD